MLTVKLKDISKADINIVGGKGANLGELIQNGFPVPPGFCVTSDAYNLYISSNGFEGEIDKNLKNISDAPNALTQLSKQIRETIVNGEMPAELLTAIKAQHHLMGQSVRMAVRSSATAEDLPEASFAGQQETFLNVIGIDQLIVAVKHCFASLWTERAIAYRKKTGFDKIKVSLAIVVQEMIEGEVSGVLFTANPLNHSLNEVVVNASYGLGESIVSGRVTPDTYTYDTNTRTVLDKYLGSKEIAVVYGEERNTVEIPVDEASRKKFCITEKDIERMAKIGKKIELHYGFPQDIEWTIKKQQIYILQTRGITTLNDKDHSEVRQQTKKQTKMERLTIDNLVEHCPTPPYPLDFVPICAVLDGRADAMKGFGIEFTNSTITLQDSGEINFNVPRLKITPKLFLMPFKLKELFQSEKNIKNTVARFEDMTEILEHYENTLVSTLSEPSLKDSISKMMALAKEIIYIRFRYNILPNVMLNNRLKRKLAKKQMTFNEYDLLSGLEYRTWQMNRDLQKLAEIAVKGTNIADALLYADTDLDQKEILGICIEQDEEFKYAYLKFIKKNGWKSLNSYQAFSTVSWNESISNFLVLFKSYLTNSKPLESGEKYAMICTQIKSTFPPKESDDILKQIEHLRIYHQNREESLYILEQCYGICRIYAKELIGRYKHLFPSFDAALYLRLDELYSLNNENVNEIKSKAELRKRSQSRNQQLWDSLELSVIQTDNKDLLKGVSGNVGKAKGRVCIITSVNEFNKISKGDILVCKYTDPIWTPLFNIAKAVVSDTGGPLSHSAIVAREFHIPAVLGCGNATKILKDGEEILVDGDSGTILRLTQAGNKN